jgi:glycine cleavage system H protein
MENRQNTQCFFVELGIISFKVCRKNFDCSHCDFAQTVLDFGPLNLESPERVRMIEQLRRLIRNREKEANPALQLHAAGTMPRGGGMDIPKDRFYHPSHIWALDSSPRQLRLGLDWIAQLLLQTITGIQISCDKSTGRIIWDFCCMGRMVQIPCPLEGHLTEVNMDVLMDPPRIHEDPYGKGWLIDLQVKKESDYAHLPKGEEARGWMAMEMERVRRFDATVMDGGDLVRNPARWIPEREWKRLVDTFLVQPATIEQL